MSKLQSYTVKEVLKAFLPAFLALLLIMLLGFCVQLLNEGLDVVYLGSLPHHIVVFSVPWVLPAAFLTAVIMAFGRLAADNEVIAIRTGGVHLFHVMAPICLGALFLSGVAAYFHFETVPRARQEIERLKYTAIKQILRDRVALSAQRQFSFSPCTVQYEDYEDGRMLDVLIVETRHQGVPRTIITASEGEITEHPRRPGYVSIALNDCAITQLTEEEMGGRGTWRASRISLPIRVAPELGDVGKDVEHLPFGKLMQAYKDLQAKVMSHPDRYLNPDAKEDELDERQDRLRVQLDELRNALGKKRKKLKRLREQDRRAREALIEQKQEEIAAAGENVELLKEEQRSYTGQLQDLREGTEEGEESYEKVTELQKKLRQTNAKLEKEQERIDRAEEAIAAAQRQIQHIERRAESLKEDIAALEKEVSAIQDRMGSLYRRREQAEGQKDFREMKVRIHRRLALSLAVFVFAMVGMPLGIMTRRRSTMVAFGIGFAIMLLLFYPFLIFGQIAAEVGMLPVEVAMWSGNAVTFAIGAVLMLRVMRS